MESTNSQYRPGVPAIHRLVTNWLLTDPNYVVSSGETGLKNYQVQNHHDMRVWYLCGGRLRTVKQTPLNIIAFLFIVVCGVLYFIYEAPWTWHHLSPGIVIVFAYLWFLTTSFFLKAATVDPGIQPRNVHIPFDASDLEHSNGPDEYFNMVSLPYYSDRVNGVTVKYCATCHIWRAPRMSHCAVCNCCVSNHDHHCIFLNNCVGYRNYRYFLWFLLTSVIVCTYLAVFSFIHCFYYRSHPVFHNGAQITTFRGSIAHFPVAFFLALAACLAAIYPLMLLSFHLFLSANNLTTREYLNYVRPSMDSDEAYVNVFDTKSIGKNLWLKWVATPVTASFLRPTQAYDEGDFSKAGLPPLRAFEN